MNNKILRDLSYGVYVVGSLDGDRKVGCIANSVMQITSNPASIAISINHDNYTNKCIKECNMFSVSILNEESNQIEELEEKEKDLIVEAGRTYVELNSASFNTTKCIALDTLVGADLLNEKFVVESIGSDYNSKYKIKVNHIKFS